MAEKDVTERLRRAVKENNLFLVKRLVQRTGMRNTDHVAKRYTSLAWAAVLGHEETFEFLLIAGHDDDDLSKDSERNTVLMLLANLVPSQDAYADEALDVDMQGAALRMARIYYDRYSYILDWSNAEGKTCLHISSIKGNEELVRMLCDLGADINLPDNLGNTPLHYASAWGHVTVVQLLIDRGCGVNLRNNEGFSASDYSYNFSTRDSIQDAVRTVAENNKRSRRNITAPIHDRHATVNPSLPPSSAPQNINSVNFGRNRSGSSTTATSDSSNTHAYSRGIGNGSSPSYSNSGSYVHVNPINHSNGVSKTAHHPTTSQSLIPPLTGSSVLSPIASRMRERDADAMAKYNMRNRSESASTDNMSVKGFAKLEVNDADSVSSLPASGSSTPRKILRPSFSAAQLRSSPQTPSIITTSPSQTDSARSRAGFPSGGSRFSPTSIVSHAFGNRSNSSNYNRKDIRTPFEPEGSPENFTGPSSNFAQFPDPPWFTESSSGSNPSASTSSVRRLPFNLLSKVHAEPTSLASHRRGSSAGNAVR